MVSEATGRWIMAGFGMQTNGPIQIMKPKKILALRGGIMSVEGWKMTELVLGVIKEEGVT